MENNLVVTKLEEGCPLPYDLLLLADPSKDNVDNYIFQSQIYMAALAGETIGCYALFQLDYDTFEIKNIAVAPAWQSKGIGTKLLCDAMEKVKSQGSKKLVIGTGNSSVGQLRLYQKVGFRITEVRKDFFTRNYSEPILENGVPCVDMIVLTMELS